MSRSEMVRLLLQRIRSGEVRGDSIPRADQGSCGTESELADDLAGTIRRAIRRRGNSLAGLARMAGVPYASLHGFVHGKQDLHLRLAPRLCGALGLEITSKSPQAEDRKEHVRA